jgi:hypothetical protein
MGEYRLSLADKGLQPYWWRVEAELTEARCSFATLSMQKNNVINRRK